MVLSGSRNGLFVVSEAAVETSRCPFSSAAPGGQRRDRGTSPWYNVTVQFSAGPSKGLYIHEGGIPSSMDIKNTVGETAGKIWEALSNDGPQTVTQLQKKINGSSESVNLALGWLAREDKVDMAQVDKKTVRVQLKTQSVR